MNSLLTLLLASSAIAVAMPEPDWSKAGAVGLVAYVVTTLGKVWLEARADARHRDDCATSLAAIKVALGIERDGGTSPLPRHGRHPKP